MTNDIRRVSIPCGTQEIAHLRAGDVVSLSGPIYTARDAAHARLAALLQREEPLPLELRDHAIYYAGPAPAKPGWVIGPVGPTTSGRMDVYTPKLLDLGLRAMIGKGRRSPEVIEAMKRNGAVYFGATGGAAALLARAVRSVRLLAFEELGPEAIRELVVENLPLVVVVDSQGNDLYEEGPAAHVRRIGLS